MYRDDYEKSGAAALMLGIAAMSMQYGAAPGTTTTAASMPPGIRELVAGVTGVAALLFGMVAVYGLHDLPRRDAPEEVTWDA